MTSRKLLDNPKRNLKELNRAAVDIQSLVIQHNLLSGAAPQGCTLFLHAKNSHEREHEHEHEATPVEWRYMLPFSTPKISTV